MTRATRPGRALILCLRQAGSDALGDELHAVLRDIDLDALVDESLRQRVGGALLTSLAVSHRRDEPAVARLRASTVQNLAWQMLVTARAVTIGAALGEADVRYAVLKGPALAEHVYQSPAWREYGDLDLLVASADAARARRVIESLGACVPAAQRNITDRGYDGEVALCFSDRMNVDLHHELVNDQDARRHFAVPVGEILQRVRDVPIGDSRLPILDPTDQLLHLCLHAAISNGRRLVWLLDIDQAVRRDPPDVAALVRRSARWKVGLVTAVMLERARSVLRTPVEDALLDELAAPSGWRRFCHGVLTVRPPEVETTKVFGGGVVVASTRESTVASTRAFARAIWRDGVIEPIRNPRHPWRRLAGQAQNP